MLNFDVIRISSRSFRNNRLRTFLTILGISVGIGTIFFLVALGYGLQKLIIEKIASENALLALDITEKNEAIKLDKAGLESIKEISEIEKAFPVVSQQVGVSKKTLSSDVKLNLVDSGYFDLEGIKLEKGDVFFDDENGVIISMPILKLLGIEKENALNQKITVFIKKDVALNSPENLIEKEYVVKGILKDSAEATVFIPLQSVADQINIKQFSKIKIKTVSNDKVSIARAKIIEKGFYVSSVSELVEQAKQVFNIVNAMLVLFGAVALIVSAIGMFNTMTIALLERTQEIGTMKALGAAKIDIWRMFLAESMIIGFMGGVGGLIIGFFMSYLLNFALNMLAKNFGGLTVELFYFPMWFTVFIVIFSTVVGLVTGFYPAKRAAKLNALEALRYK